MAAGTAVQSYHSSTAGTGAELVGLLQFWDRIEITNKDDTSYMYVRFDGTTAVAAAAGTQVIPPGGAKVFGPGFIQNGAGIPGDTTAANYCHRISLITGAASDTYSIEGIAG